MATQPPILDDRDLKAILNQLRALAGQHVPEWTPPAKGEGEDAGTMLHRIYARLLELVLQRLNQVPEKNLLAFLDTMGVSLLPPAPAKVPLTFTLTTGSPPTLIPQGSQAGNQAIEPQPALLFETEEDFTVVPAQITQAFTIDPTYDRYADQTEAIVGSEIAFTPFVGTKHLPHILYLGDDILLDFRNGATVTVTFNWESDRPATEVIQFFQQLSYWYQSQGNIKLATLSNIIDSAPNPIQLKFFIADLLDQEIIQGVGVSKNTPSRWLRADLTTPIQNNPIAQTLQLNNLNLKVSATNLLPDLAFANNTLLDLTKEFLPFGEAPKIGDTFYLASTEAFSKVEPQKGREGDQVTINVTSRTTNVKLRWRFVGLIPLGAGPPRGGPMWIEFTPDEDSTKSFTQSGSIRFPDFEDNIDFFPFEGIVGFLVEVTIIDGNYQRAPLIESGNLEVSSVGVFSVELEPYTNEFAVGEVPRSPVSEDRRFKRIKNSNFFPFGRVPRVGSSFYFVSPVKNERGDEISANFELAIVPPVQLVWEYFGLGGWIRIILSDSFGAFNPDTPQSNFRPATFTFSGLVRFNRPTDFIPVAVNGETNFWIRIRFIGGSYGRSNELVPVDAADLRKGYQQLPDTLSINRPIIQKLTFSYESERIPTVVTQNSFLYTDQTEANQNTKFAPFVSAKDLISKQYADPNPAFYLGFDTAFPQQPVRLYVDVSPRSFSGSREQKNSDSSSSALPTLQWQYFNGNNWVELAVFDRTNNLTESGTVDFLTPPDIVKFAKFDLREQYWIRTISPFPEKNPLKASPNNPSLKAPPNNPSKTQQLRGVYLNTTPAIQAVAVASATLGSGNGLPNQTLRFTRVPVLPGQQVLVQEPEPPSDREQVVLETEEGKDAIQTRLNSVTGEPEIWVRWHEVPNFIGSDPTSRHYTLDHVTGVLTFGDGQRGLIPPRGTNNITATYQAGGGAVGNLPKAAIDQVKSSLQGVAAVTNPIAADGGAESETFSQVKSRGAQTLRHRDRAVTSSDLEWLAQQASGTRIARAKCLPNLNRDLRFEPGWVTLLIVPQGTEPKLSPSSELIREVEDYLAKRAFVGLVQQTPARLNVIGCGYTQVTVAAELVPRNISQAQQIRQQALTALNAFSHPLTGGIKGKGWEFGRDVYVSEIYYLLEQVPGVDHVKSLRLLPNQHQAWLTFNNAPVTTVDLPIGSLVKTTDGRKSVILAAPVPQGTKLDRIAVKGFKEGDRLQISKDAQLGSLDPFPLTITTVVADNNNRTLNLRIEPYETDTFFPGNSLVTTLDKQVYFPLFPLSTKIGVLRPNQIYTAISVQGFTTEDQVEIRHPGGALLVTGLEFSQITPSDDQIIPIDDQITPINDIVYLEDNFLIYPGAHQITMVTDTATLGRK